MRRLEECSDSSSRDVIEVPPPSVHLVNPVYYFLILFVSTAMGGALWAANVSLCTAPRTGILYARPPTATSTNLYTVSSLTWKILLSASVPTYISEGRNESLFQH